MKEVKAIAKNVRSTARKARIPADAVRGMKAEYALDVLKYMNKGAALHVRKALASAVANAVENEKMDLEKLFVSQIFVNEAVTMKRFRPQSKGRVRQILKRNCHITVFVADGVMPKTTGKVAKASAKPVEEKVTEAEVVEAKPKRAAKKTEAVTEAKTKQKATKSKSTTKK